MGSPPGCITHKAFARIGLLGNPSDGYYGKTISFSLENFWATVWLAKSDSIRFIPHPTHDVFEFDSLDALAERVKSEGYYGGVRLLMAICYRFYDYCQMKGIALEKLQFSLSYDTNVPRQAGLAGSSAIVCAALSCLIEFFDVGSQIPVDERPNIILSAESELGITAGLQDRVVQVYGGLVYMDFNEEHFKAQGKGVYMPMDPALLPRMHLVYCSNPSDSGKVHSTVRKLWLAGDTLIRSKMEEVAMLAEEGKTALHSHDVSALATLMDRNFHLRREMFGEEVVGATNIRMVEVVRSVGAAAKFTGSGGAIVALCPAGDAQAQQLKAACARSGLTCVETSVGPAYVSHT